MAQQPATKRAKLNGSAARRTATKPRRESARSTDSESPPNEDAAAAADGDSSEADGASSGLDDSGAESGSEADSGAPESGSDSSEASSSDDDDDDKIDGEIAGGASVPRSRDAGDHFGAAMEAILGSRVKAHDAGNPILIRNKRPAKEIEDARDDAKARKALRAERLQQKDKARVRDVIPKDPEAAGDVLSREKKLRKTAQRGVVKLLNAIHSAQAAALQAGGGGPAPDKRAAEATTEMSKEKFLDMIRMG